MTTSQHPGAEGLTDERKAFEAEWGRRWPGSLKARFGGSYVSDSTQCAWDAWQARAVLAAPQAPALPAQRAQEPTDWKIKTPSGQVIYTDVDPRFEYTQSWLDDCYYITPLYAAPQEQALHREEALSRVRAVMARHHFQSRSFAEDLLDALGIGTVVPAETKQGEHQ